MKSKATMNYQDVIDLGYKPYEARRIIRLAKDYMVQSGFPLYNNKRMGVVPIKAITKITGVPLCEKKDDRKKCQ